jgi:O-antigen/teichoic acid export membrane protein
LRGCAAAVGLLLATTALREVAVTMPQLRQRTGLVAAFNLFLDYGGALLAVALVWSGLGPAAVIWAQGGVAALGIALASLRTRAELGWSPGVDRAFLGSALAVGLPVLPVGLGQWALQSLDNLFLAAWHGEAALGSYGLAYTLASPVTLVLASANFVFFPTASAVLKEGRERLRAFLARAFRLAAAALGLLVCGALLLAPWAVRLLAGPRYPTAAQVLPALALAWALFTLLQLLQFVELVIARRTARIAAAYGGMAALNVALNFALIPGLGIQGAALATVLSYAGGLLLMGLLAHRALPEFGWWRPFLAGAAPGLALAPAAALLAVPPSAPLWQAAASTAALVAGFLGLARATGAIGAHDLELARSLLDRR